jgi:hypothetical protein
LRLEEVAVFLESARGNGFILIPNQASLLSLKSIRIFQNREKCIERGVFKLYTAHTVL